MLGTASSPITDPMYGIFAYQVIQSVTFVGDHLSNLRRGHVNSPSPKKGTKNHMVRLADFYG